MVCLISQSKLDDEALGGLTLASAPGGEVISGDRWLQGTEAVAWVFWPGQLGLKKKKKREKEGGKKKIRIGFALLGEFLCLGTGPRERRGADLARVAPRSFMSSSQLLRQNAWFSSYKRKRPDPAASCLPPALPGCSAAGCRSPRPYLAASGCGTCAWSFPPLGLQLQLFCSELSRSSPWLGWKQESGAKRAW